MSMPNIPNIDTNINISKEDSLNIILASIGLEELSLAHLINAEAEKIQFALGTLDSAKCPQSFDDILIANKSAQEVLKNSLKMQLLLGMKLGDVLEMYEKLSECDELNSVSHYKPKQYSHQNKNHRNNSTESNT